MTNYRPTITFGCELETGDLTNFFSDDKIIRLLQDINARVSLAIIDLSDERAMIVKKLNSAGIPVIAWLVLPKDDGYWFNLGNSQKAATFYGQFKCWTQKHLLQWYAIGLDIEPDVRLFDDMRHDRWKTILNLFKKVPNRHHYYQAVQDYRAMIIQMRIDGYQIHSYQFPFIADERKAGSNLLQRLTGILDIPADQEVLMLYTSFIRGAGEGIIAAYGNDAQAIGIGSTGGGVDLNGVFNTTPLTWDELKRDLFLARQYTDEIFIFSLEGCHKNGFLDRIVGVPWDGEVEVHLNQIGSIFRKVAQGFLWILARPWILIVGLLIAIRLSIPRNRDKGSAPHPREKSLNHDHPRGPKTNTRSGIIRQQEVSAKLRSYLIRTAIDLASTMLTRTSRKNRR